MASFWSGILPYYQPLGFEPVARAPLISRPGRSGAGTDCGDLAEHYSNDALNGKIVWRDEPETVSGLRGTMLRTKRQEQEGPIRRKPL